MHHVLGEQDLVQLLLAHEAVFEHQVVDALAGLQGLLGQHRRGLVTQVGIERRDESDAVVDHPAADFGVGRDADDALLAQRVHGIDQHLDVLEERVDDDRLHDVELELSGLVS